MIFGKYDLEAAAILNDFLPDKIYDAHGHLTDSSLLDNVQIRGRIPERFYDLNDYCHDMKTILGDRELFLNFFYLPGINADYFNRTKEAEFLVQQLDQHPDSSAEVIVLPDDDEETIEKQLTHPRIRGLKCYHTFRHRQGSYGADIGEYLPESAWRVADKHGLCITLHMVKDKALADPENLNYIKTMADRYPNAVLILAHAARAFASWTGVETIGQLRSFENIWFDVAAVCESPAIFTVLKEVGPSRCMWGSDYPIVLSQGKIISLADGFYRIYPEDVEHFSSSVPIHTWNMITENLMAVRQACIMANMNRSQVEKVFYRNARDLFGNLRADGRSHG